MDRKRILFFAEAVTLAHVARPIALSAALPKDRFETFLACDSRYRRFIDAGTSTPLPLESISSEQFLAALASGSPVYDLPTLRTYLQADLALIDQVRPDFIVGDFRLSLGVSARLRGIPYAAISNSYWSPYYRYQQFPLPVLPLTKALPLAVAQPLFAIGQKFAFPAHCRPLNQLRRESGLAPLTADLRTIYTDADYVLYADDPQLFPLEQAPDSHQVIGPIPWSPPVPVPPNWADLDPGKPTVYLTLGSSGSPAVANAAFRALSGMDINLIAAMPSGQQAISARARTFVSEYVPGAEAANLADLVVCNGGSPTSQQALAAGKPVLGIAGNMDQFLNMEGLVRAGVGSLLRADRLKPAALPELVTTLLTDLVMQQRVRQICKQKVVKSAMLGFLAFLEKRLVTSGV